MAAVRRLCGKLCYSPNLHICNGTHLVWDRSVHDPVVLQAANLTTDLDGEYIQAVDGHLQVGGAPNVGHCPDTVPSDECPRHDNTVFSETGYRLAVVVTWGQNLYLKTDGSVAFTKASDYHSEDRWKNNVIEDGASNYESNDVFLTGWNGSSFLACKAAATEPYRLYTANLVASREGKECKTMNIVSHKQPQGSFGAWYYI